MTFVLNWILEDFRGYYINGEKNGKGIESSMFPRFIFLGEFVNGKRSGKGEEYKRFGELQ